MLYRKIYQDIKEWYLHQNNALLIDGARQIGKTTIIETFLKQEKVPYVSFNLIDEKSTLEVFNTSNSAQQILMRLSAIKNLDLTNENTLIFIDEVQAADDAITPIKYLIQDGRYRFIFSGSLLGVKIKDIESFPVGFLKIIQMYPMDFEEFMLANKVSSTTMNHLKDCYEKLEPVDTVIHKQVMNLFNTYLAVGGMPEAVQEFVDSNNIGKVQSILRDIDNAYRVDISKYGEKEKLNIQDVYNLIPSELNNPNKRFILKNLNENARFRKYEDSFVWILNSGVGIFAFNIDNPTYPLLASKERNLFKLFLCDVGLLASKLYANQLVEILNGETKVNYGAVYESVVAQELMAHGYDLYYYNNKKRGEVDFVIEEEDKIIPIEVKSGKDYVKHSALNNLLNGNESVQKAFIFNNNNLKVVDNKIYLPIYMVMFLKKRNENHIKIFKPDISKLI